MAFFVPGGGTVAAISGKFGNAVFYRGRWGNTIRAWAYPVNTPSPFRTIYRGNFASLVSLYNSLTPAMQNDWAEYAHEFDTLNRLGARYIPTGLQQFITVNMNLLTCGFLPLLIPNGHDLLIPLERITITALHVGTFNVSARLIGGGTNLGPNLAAVYAATDNQIALMRNKLNRYRIIGVVPPNGNIFGSALPQWNAAWNPSVLTVGKRIFFKGHIVNINTGQASRPTFTSALVT